MYFLHRCPINYLLMSNFALPGMRLLKAILSSLICGIHGQSNRTTKTNRKLAIDQGFLDLLS
jgi:hypothetical protein